MTYTLLSTKNLGIFSGGYMPIFCSALTNAWCPLKKGQNVFYSVPFQLESPSLEWSIYTYTPKRFILQIDLYKENKDGTSRPIFSFELEVKLKGCYLHLFC